MTANDYKPATILITGATGNIGARIIVDLLGCRQNVRVLALVRGESERRARERLNASMRRIAPELVDWGSTQAVEVLCGDITDADLGLLPVVRDSLIISVTHIIHAAASTQWHLPLNCARAVNVVGTEHMLEFARQAHRRGSLRRFTYVSTAYVCGEKDGEITEIPHIGELRFANTYEQTKWEAEQRVAALADELPVAIVRPSITVGDSRTGLAVTYNVLYPPLKYILTGRLTTLICPPENRLDLVPVDYVARAVCHLTLHADFGSGTIFHLTAGRARSLAIAEIVRRALGLIGDGRAIPVNYVNETGSTQSAASDSDRRVAVLLKLYSSYLQIERDFDDTNTRRALNGSGISLPNLSNYIDTLLTTFIAQEIPNRGPVSLTARSGARL